MLATVAAVCFILAAFGVRFDPVEIVPLGLFFLALALLFGNWPMGLFVRRQ